MPKIYKNDLIIIDTHYKVKPLRQSYKTNEIDKNFDLIALIKRYNINKIYTNDTLKIKKIVSKNYKLKYKTKITNEMTQQSFFVFEDGKSEIKIIHIEARYTKGLEILGKGKEYIQNWVNENKKLNDVLTPVVKNFGATRVVIQPTLAKTGYNLLSNFVRHRWGQRGHNIVYNYYDKFSPELLTNILFRQDKAYINNVTTPNKEYNNVYRYDINSAYPFHLSKAVPFGIPVKESKLCKYKYKRLYLIKMVSFEQKKECKMPSLISFNELGYIKKSPYGIKKTIWEDELKYLKTHYNIEYKVIEKYSFKSHPIFKDVVEELNKNKYKNKNVKQLMNLAIGKMGSFLYLKDEDLVSDEEIREIVDVNVHPPIQISSYILSQTRLQIWKTIEKKPESFLYSHTDSIFTKEKMPIKTNNTKLGAFKKEGICKKIKFFSVNNYVWIDENNQLQGKGYWENNMDETIKYMKQEGISILYKNNKKLRLSNNKLVEVN